MVAVTTPSAAVRTIVPDVLPSGEANVPVAMTPESAGDFSAASAVGVGVVCVRVGTCVGTCVADGDAVGCPAPGEAVETPHPVARNTIAAEAMPTAAVRVPLMVGYSQIGCRSGQWCGRS
ncbi:hypothetical protein GCM10009627_15660 [Curtobacterium herbarum]|uniref:Uncharacterized protein n=1 Tax=Curtobacterium herbarum TaxID=150122 RepID=A0ABN1ZC82_9MICO